MQMRALEKYKEAKTVFSSRPKFFDPYNKELQILKKSLALFKEAADLGHVEAMYHYGKYSLINVKQEDSINYLISAAEKGHTLAQFDMFRYYHEGRPSYGIEQNEELALKLARLIDKDQLKLEDQKKLQSYLDSSSLEAKSKFQKT